MTQNPSGLGDLSRRDAMKGGLGAASLAAIGTGAAVPATVSIAPVAITTGTAQAQQLSPCAPMSNVTLPATGIVMHPDYARTIAQMAYVWGWPIINMINRRAAITQAPQPGHLNGVLPAAPRGQIAMLADYIEPSQTFVTCPNQDVVYGLGFFSLDEEPVVIQVPDFGDRFWVYALYDARTDQFGHLGKPYKSRPGFYLLVGPRWSGLRPAGITDVIRCSTSLANAIPRVFQDDTPEDKKAIQPVINQVVVYPLKDFTGEMKTIEWAKAPNIPGPKSSGEETKWVVPEKFFDQFGEALDIVDPLPGEAALYGQFRLLLDAASKDPELKKVLVATAVETEQKSFIRSSSGNTTDVQPAMDGTVRPTMRSSGSTISTGPGRRNRTCSTIGRPRRNISIPTMTALVVSSPAAAATRSLSRPDRSRRSTAFGH